VETFSIGFADSDESEHTAAAAIAAHLGTRHHQEIVDLDALERLPEIAADLDQRRV
jgi:asparagine synthetase B (glutamine-hydrolysing)